MGHLEQMKNERDEFKSLSRKSLEDIVSILAENEDYTVLANDEDWYNIDQLFDEWEADFVKNIPFHLFIASEKCPRRFFMVVDEKNNEVIKAYPLFRYR